MSYRDDRQAIMDALGWHDVGSQDERREKAIPAFHRIEAERDTLRTSLDALRTSLEEARQERDAAYTVLGVKALRILELEAALDLIASVKAPPDTERLEAEMEGDRRAADGHDPNIPGGARMVRKEGC